jgi:carbonic anhydrase
MTEVGRNLAAGHCCIDRRRMLAISGGSLAAVVAGAPARALEEAPKPGEDARSPEHALEGLKTGNARFTSQPQLCELDLVKHRAEVAEAQAPWATVLGCADSRVPPELVFGGLGLGELFVARNAGNLADTGTMGTLEYGAAVLGSPLIIVLGHSHCGAVKAACQVVSDNQTFPGSIGPMIDPIIPAALAARSRDGDFLDNSVRESALRTANRLTQASSVLAGLVKAGKLKILAAHYDLATGKVEYLA